MAGKRAVVEKSRSQVQVLTFEIEIKVAPGVDADVSELHDTIADALYAYDDQRRLFPGARTPPGGERLIGTAIQMTKSGREADWRTQDLLKNWKKPPFWDAAKEVTGRAIDVNTAIHDKIEELRAAQAKLSTAYDETTNAETDEAFRAAKRKLAASVAACCKVLGVELDQIPVAR